MDLGRQPRLLRRILRRLLLTVVSAAGLLVVGLLVGAWYYSNQLLPAAGPRAGGRDVEVTAIDADVGTITLAALDDAPAADVADLTLTGVVGLETDRGYLQLTELVDSEGVTATREFDVVAGQPPAIGDLGDVQVHAYPADPAALGVPVSEVTVPGPLGDLPAYRFGETAGDGTWAVLVHGRGGTRAETYRAVRILDEAGIPSLAVTYRNDPEAPPSPDGFGHYGDTEWEDVQAAIDWLQDEEDAARFVLYGFSQGGGIVATVLRRSPDTDTVAAAILDSPLLSLQATLELQAANRGIPGPAIGPLLAVTKALSDWRSGLDFSAVEHVASGDVFDVPMLVFHGRGDTTVPFAPSEALGEQRDDIVEFVPYNGEHVRGWNVDPEAYADSVRTFLDAVR